MEARALREGMKVKLPCHDSAGLDDEYYEVRSIYHARFERVVYITLSGESRRFIVMDWQDMEVQDEVQGLL